MEANYFKTTFDWLNKIGYDLYTLRYHISLDRICIFYDMIFNEIWYLGYTYYMDIIF